MPTVWPYGIGTSQPPFPPTAGGSNYPPAPLYSPPKPAGWSGEGVDWAALQASSPELYKALSGLVGRKGFGQAAGLVFSNIARAATARPLYGQNDIRNAALQAQNMGASQARDAARGLAWQAALGGALDSGGYVDELQRSTAQIGANADQQALGRIQEMLGANQDYLRNLYQTALSSAQQWAQGRRQNRMAQAELQAALAALAGAGGGSSALGSIGSLLGSVGLALI